MNEVFIVFPYNFIKEKLYSRFLRKKIFINCSLINCSLMSYGVAMLIKRVHIFLMLVLMFFFTNEGLPQQADTTVKIIKIFTKQKSVISPKDSLKKMSPKNKLKLKGFVDKNADGIDDRLQGKNSKSKGKHIRRRDLFIDKNGDGICDGRESAIGLRKIRRHRMGKK